MPYPCEECEKEERDANKRCRNNCKVYKKFEFTRKIQRERIRRNRAKQREIDNTVDYTKYSGYNNKYR